MPDLSFKRGTSALRFSLGDCFVTATANEAGVFPTALLQRHWQGDWGDLCDEDKALNEEALEAKDGRRIFSRYNGCGPDQDVDVYVITDEPFTDRTRTTLMLVQDY